VTPLLFYFFSPILLNKVYLFPSGPILCRKCTKSPGSKGNVYWKYTCPQKCCQ